MSHREDNLGGDYRKGIIESLEKYPRGIAGESELVLSDHALLNGAWMTE